MWIVRLALRRPYTFVVMALVLFLFAAETVPYGLLWHNQPAQSPGRECPRGLERRFLCRWLRGDWRKPAAGGETLGEIERQLP
jgi:hypothetical protein